MSKVTCKTIADILPLYVDGVVSDDTRKLVSEHLDNCPDCQKKYEGMKKEFSLPIDNDTKPLLQFRKEVTKGKKSAFRKGFLIAVVVACICSAIIFRAIYVNNSYYPMGGEVTIVDKEVDGDKYYITVEQGKPDDAGWGQFVLSCTQEQYESVDVGDVVVCERDQSVVTNKGTVHRIYEK